MAQPLDLEVTVPLQGDGFVKIRVHVDNVETMNTADQQFLLDLLDRVHKFTSEMLMLSQHKEDT